MSAQIYLNKIYVGTLSNNFMLNLSKFVCVCECVCVCVCVCVCACVYANELTHIEQIYGSEITT